MPPSPEPKSSVASTAPLRRLADRFAVRTPVGGSWATGSVGHLSFEKAPDADLEGAARSRRDAAAPGVRSIVTPVYTRSPGDDDAPSIPTGTIHLRLKGRAAELPHDVGATVQAAGARVSRRRDGVWVVRMAPERTWPDGPDPVEFATQLAALADVRFADADLAVRADVPSVAPEHALSCPIPADWHLNDSFVPRFDANVKGAWRTLEERGRRRQGSPSIPVAVIDFGFAAAHPDFARGGVPPSSASFGPAPSVTHMAHGTGVAGLALAADDGVHALGVAPGCTPLLATCGEYFYDEAITDWLEWAIDQGAAVVNCSWRMAAQYHEMSPTLRDAIAERCARGRSGLGTVVVFSAADNGRLLFDPPHYCNDFPRHPDVLGVGGLGRDGLPTADTNFGDGVAVFAPTASSGSSLFTSGVDSGGQPASDCGFGGTSGAAPIVAGVAALVLTARPDLSARQVRQVIVQSARVLPAHAPTRYPGQTFPVRLVDADAAVRAALAMP